MEGTRDTATPANTAMHRWGGVALLCVAIVTFGLQNNLSKVSYGYGVSVLTLLCVRTWFIAAVLVVWLLLIRQSPVMGRARMPRMVWVALLFAVNAFTLLQSIELVPVSLAVLAFYTFPLFVALLSAAVGEEKLSGVTLAGLVVAFGGLALALDVSAGGQLLLGVGLAVLSGVAIAFNIIGSRRLMRDTSGPVVSFNMFLIAALVFTVAMFAEGGPRFPGGGAEGWITFLAAAGLAPLSLVSFYLALEYVTGTKASLIMNGEPVVTVLFAVLLFGEAFTMVQTVGAALVIGAIVAVTLWGRRAARQAPA